MFTRVVNPLGVQFSLQVCISLVWMGGVLYEQLAWRTAHKLPFFLPTALSAHLAEAP